MSRHVTASRFYISVDRRNDIINDRLHIENMAFEIFIPEGIDDETPGAKWVISFPAALPHSRCVANV